MAIKYFPTYSRLKYKLIGFGFTNVNDKECWLNGTANISEAEWQEWLVLLWAYPHSRGKRCSAVGSRFSRKPATIKTLFESSQEQKRNLSLMEKDRGGRVFLLHDAQILEADHLEDTWPELFDNICNTKHGDLF